MYKRPIYQKQIEEGFRIHAVVAILGPRQCGKTTLALSYIKSNKGEVHYFDMENPRDLSFFDNPMLALEDLTGLIIIDEIQLRPELFPILRVLVDQKKRRKFLILGSASRDLLRQSSETLAGRIQYIELNPFSFSEVKDYKKLWLRGGFPLSYSARTLALSAAWRESYISTFLERDIPQLGITVPPRTLRRFWMMLAHYHGQIFNSSEIGKSLGIAHTTARHYLDILTGTFMIRELSPWFENISKRQIKSPKIFFRDSGIFHSLMEIADERSLQKSPKLGASWEGMALEQIIMHHQAKPTEAYFWGIHNQAELDLLIIKGGKRIGFEIKYRDTLHLTSSMATAYEILKLDKLYAIFPGNTKNFPLAPNIEGVGIEAYLKK